MTQSPRANDKEEDSREPISAMGGRFSWRVSFRKVRHGEVATVKVKDVATETDLGPLPPDEFTLDSEECGTPKDIANWLETEAVEKVSLRFLDKAGARLQDMHKAVTSIVHQLMGTRDRTADILR
jgi:hypothetical protein